MATPLHRWNDERLDDLNGRLRRVEPIVTEVAVLAEQMRNLGAAVEKNTTATEKVGQQLEDAQNETVQHGRQWRAQLGLVLIGTLTGGTLAFVSGVIANGGFH